MISPKTFAATPERATLDLLVHTTEVAIIALCAAHPHIQHRPPHTIPIDCLADRVVVAALALLDTVGDYQRLTRDLARLHSGDPSSDGSDF